MSTEPAVWLLVTLVRLAVPFAVFRWSLAGALAGIAADTFDFVAFRTFGFRPPGIEGYQIWDKLLDAWYLALLWTASRHWTDALARRAMTALLAWRLVGVVALGFTGLERLLVFAPNIVENFYLFWVASLKWFPFRLTASRLAFILLAVGIPKVWQEYMMHWRYPGIDPRVWLPLI